MPQLYSQWIATWAQGNPNAFVWTIRGITEHGIYITCPRSRLFGHLLSLEDFQQDYRPHWSN